MQIRSFVHAVAVLGLTACMSGGVPGASQTPPPNEPWTPTHGEATSKPKPSAEPVAEAPSKPKPSEVAKQLMKRAEAACSKAWQAVKIDGSDDAISVHNQVSNCLRDADDCEEFAKASEKKSLVGAISGRACLAVKEIHPNVSATWIVKLAPQVAKAEKLADDSIEAANKVVADRKAMEEAIMLERANLKAAFATCAGDKAKCKTTCEKGDHFHCIVRAEELANANKYVEAKVLYVKACEAKVMTACPLVGQIDKAAAKYAAEIDGLWKDVEQPGDSIAEKRYMIGFVKTKLPQTPKNVKGAQMMDIHVKAITSEQYCPARKAFIAKVGLAEYQSRTKQHCKDKPPVGTGLSGAEVTLTTECNAAFATACP